MLPALVALCAPAIVNAQALRVTVRNAAGKPIAFAAVELLHDTTPAARSSPLAGQTTNDRGQVNFDGIPPESHYLRVRRVAYAPVIVTLGAREVEAGELDVVIEEMSTVRARQDSIAGVRHRARVAIARSRPRHWVCALGDSVAHARARSAYQLFAGGDGQGMHKVASEYGMPNDETAFTRIFVDPLTPAECVRFAEGLDRRTDGLETDTVEVYRFGKAFYLPWYGGYEGGFADADGKVLGVFIVPD